jgi:hypothetical protein
MGCGTETAILPSQEDTFRRMPEAEHVEYKQLTAELAA